MRTLCLIIKRQQNETHFYIFFKAKQTVNRTHRPLNASGWNANQRAYALFRREEKKTLMDEPIFFRSRCDKKKHK